MAAPNDPRYEVLRQLESDILGCATAREFARVNDSSAFRTALGIQRTLLSEGDGNRVSHSIQRSSPNRPPRRLQIALPLVQFCHAKKLGDSLLTFCSSQLVNACLWAERFRITLDPEATYVNACRSVCLNLVYKMCDRWWRDETITTELLLKDFGLDRLLRILEVSMLLDFAQCLFKMNYAVGEQIGMHWVAAQHREVDGEMWNGLLNGLGGFCTMNKRYLWLSELRGLPPENDAVLAACFQPTFAPWHVPDMNAVSTASFQPTFLPSHVLENVVARMSEPINVGVGVSLRSLKLAMPTLRQAVSTCQTVGDFLNVYNRYPFQISLDRVRSMIGTRDRREWSVEWATRMRANPRDPADEFCDSTRQLLLHYLDRLMKCSQDTANPDVSETLVVSTLQRHRIVNMMVLCLPMQFAWCRHACRYDDYPSQSGTTLYGLCWFSEQDAQTNSWRQWRELGPATIPPSFQWLKNLEGLELTHETLVVDLVTPFRPEWAQEELDSDSDVDGGMELE